MTNRRLAAKLSARGHIMQPIKQEALNTIEQLPEDVDMEEIMYRLYVVDKIRKGQQAIEDGQTISHEDMKKEIDKW